MLEPHAEVGRPNVGNNAIQQVGSLWFIVESKTTGLSGLWVGARLVN